MAYDVSVATYDMRMPGIRGGTLGWNINIYSTPTDQSFCSIACAYVINIYMDTKPITLLCSLAKGREYINIHKNNSITITTTTIKTCCNAFGEHVKETSITNFSTVNKATFHRYLLWCEIAIHKTTTAATTTCNAFREHYEGNIN